MPLLIPVSRVPFKQGLDDSWELKCQWTKSSSITLREFIINRHCYSYKNVDVRWDVMEHEVIFLCI